MKQTLFRVPDARAPLIALSAAIAGLMLLGSTAKAADIDGNATLTSDYVWRGSTQTQGDPAVQAGFKIAADSGLYASAWGSNVDFGPAVDADTELDFTVGWGKQFNDDWALDINALRYQYPSTTVDLDWTELNGTLTYKGSFWASVGYSNEALGYDAHGTYVQVGAKLPVDDRFRFEATAAHYFLDEGVVGRSGYSHGSVSAIWAFKPPFEARLTAHVTDGNAKALFGDDFAGSRVEAALQTSF